MMSSCWAWLGPALAEYFYVLAYDRAGLGWSDERTEVRDSNQLARELSAILQVVAPGKDVILVGHSMGAMHAHALVHLQRQRISGLVFLDGAHPAQMKRVRRIQSRMNNFFLYLESAALVARSGLAGSWSDFPLMNQVRGLPEEELKRFKRFFHSVRHLRTTAKEARAWTDSTGTPEAQSLGTLPLLVITAQKKAFPRWDELQADLGTLSSKATRLVFTDASHLSLICNRSQAQRTAQAIITWYSAG